MSCVELTNLVDAMPTGAGPGAAGIAAADIQRVASEQIVIVGEETEQFGRPVARGIPRAKFIIDAFLFAAEGRLSGIARYAGRRKSLVNSSEKLPMIIDVIGDADTRYPDIEIIFEDDQ